MTGLNLETFLRLVRADIGPWISFGVIVLLLALMAWTGWGRKKALRKCLVLSIVVHFALLLYGGPRAAQLLVPAESEDPESRPVERIRSISVVPEEIEGSASKADRGRLSDWDHPEPLLAAADLDPPAERNEAPEASPLERTEPESLPEPVRETQAPPVELPEPAQLAEPSKPAEPQPPDEPPTEMARTLPGEEAEPVVEPAKPAEVPSLAMPELVPEKPRSRPAPAPERARSSISTEPVPTNVPAPPPGPAIAALTGEDAPERPRTPQSPSPEIAVSPSSASLNDIPNLQPIGAKPKPSAPIAMPDSPTVGRSIRGSSRSLTMPDLPRPRRSAVPEAPALVHASAGAGPSLPAMASPSRDRPLPEIPEVYRSRLAPNRSEIARKAGASEASEAAVVRALEWLARHQDADGRWNGGTRKAPGGDGRTPLPGETNFTRHCPPGRPCTGECHYWEADTAMTGLALLSFLGAGHTHQGGKYARTITLGLKYLLRTQRPDGDLRGESANVGMYCHAIASLALCEAYALTRDERLKPSVQRAVDFLVKSRSTDGLGWRYSPRDPNSGDTSILGWAILVLKSAKETGISVPAEVRDGALIWLNKVAKGDHGGLAVYRPFPREGFPITPTMTAEAWVCRQFLGVGGPGPASDEAAAYLLLHGPDRAPFNLYYWYYGTLSMYQHGGSSWTRWNARVRDQLVRRQVLGGHADGSWDPAECRDQYDRLGGRIYCTALATLTLEVYYRYLRLYDAPEDLPPTDQGVRRTSGSPLPDLPRPELPDSP